MLVSDSGNTLCHRDDNSLLIFGTQEHYKRYIQDSQFKGSDIKAQKINFGKIMEIVNNGNKVCLFKEAYNKFYPIAQINDLPYDAVEFEEMEWPAYPYMVIYCE